MLSARSPGRHSPRVQQLLSRDSFQEAWQQYMGRARAAQAHAVLATSAATAAAGFQTTSSGSGDTAAAQNRRTGASLQANAIAGLKMMAPGTQQKAVGDGVPKGGHRKSSRGRRSALDQAGKVHHAGLTACLRSAKIMPSTSGQMALQAIQIMPGMRRRLAAAGPSTTVDALQACPRSLDCLAAAQSCSAAASGDLQGMWGASHSKS